MSDHGRRIRRQHRHSLGLPLRRAPTNPQAKILSGLNILTVLADKAPAYLQHVVDYGPASFVGPGWACVVVWYCDKGYHGYQTLTLFGVWAVGVGENATILLAAKSLQYRAAVFNPESYYALIARDFRTYYGDAGEPPPKEAAILQCAYDPLRRLELRRELADAIEQWLQDQQP